MGSRSTLGRVFGQDGVHVTKGIYGRVGGRTLFHPGPSPRLIRRLRVLSRNGITTFRKQSVTAFSLTVVQALPELGKVSTGLHGRLVGDGSRRAVRDVTECVPSGRVLRLASRRLNCRPIILKLLSHRPLSIRVVAQVDRLPSNINPLGLTLHRGLPLSVIVALTGES